LRLVWILSLVPPPAFAPGFNQQLAPRAFPGSPDRRDASGHAAWPIQLAARSFTGEHSLMNSLRSVKRWSTAAAAALALTSTAAPAAAQSEILVTTSKMTSYAGDWRKVSDSSAAESMRLWNPDRGAGKLTSALASPGDYVEFTFAAEAGRAYRLWIRGRAENDAWTNDSVFIQFDKSVDAGGTPIYRIGSGAGTSASIEACKGCGVSGWGWEDDEYGGDAAPIYFASTGTQRMRVQRREDGISIDQIVLSASQYRWTAPGANQGDSTIVGSSTSGGGGSPTVSGSTLVLNDSSATVLRGGSYASTNFSSQQLLETRASSDPTYVRHIQTKFDTHNTIPAGTPIASAKLTLTVAGGNDETRQLTAFRGGYSYNEWEANWYQRKSGKAWPTAGGDMSEVAARQSATSGVGSKVTFDVTSVVQNIVNGGYGGSRYARFLIADMGGSSRAGYKQFYSDEAADPNVRPVLSVTLGSGSSGSGSTTPPPSTSPPPPTSGTGVKLRVLDWNLHHGVGTDGAYNIDRIATWIARLNPDVVMLNEVEKFTSWGNEDQPARYEALLEAKTGRQWYGHFAQEFGQWSSPGKGHLILSTYRLESVSRATITQSSGLKGAGAISQATITVNGRTINLLVTHLDPYDQSMRLTQARDAIRWASGFAENRIITGDMNAWPDQSSIAEFNKTYNDSWAVAEANGTATGISGISPFGATRNGRIDYIFYSKGASNLFVLSSQTPDTRDSSGVMPSDHRPVLTTFDVR
jgi:endonuclease/exonuclease/phosphatase family metal-dependent hydrolase